MQEDGNLVVYGPGWQGHWASATENNHGARLIVQDDGNVAIYRPGGTAIWSTNTNIPVGPTAQGDDMQPGEVLLPGQSLTSSNGRFTFVYQSDGNLALYGPGGAAMWASRTDGRVAGACIMQEDGNLVVYGPGWQGHWASATENNHGARLIVQDDGNVVIYNSAWTPIWATNT
jgi:hypothetical protein